MTLILVQHVSPQSELLKLENTFFFKTIYYVHKIKISKSSIEMFQNPKNMI